MGREKVVNYYNDRFCGDMSENQCDILEGLIEVDAQNGYVCDLKHMIYDLSDSDVIDLIEDYEMFNAPMHDYDMRYGTLFDYQTLAVCFMYYANRCILGDSVGMGKTVATAGVVNLIKREMGKAKKHHRYLVLTEKNLAEQFRTEIVKFTGEFVQLIPSGEANEIQKFVRDNPYGYKLDYSVVGTHALFTTAGFLQWLEQCRTMGEGFPFDTLIVDESSVLGGSGTKIVSGYKAISKYFRNIYFLNATPFEDNLEILYNQLNLLDGKLLPTKKNFKAEYCIMDYRGMFPRPTGKYKNHDNFRHLIGYRYFARTRRDKGATMINCKGGVVLSRLSDAQKELLKKSQLRRMVYDCPSYIDPSIEFNVENVPKLESLKTLLDTDCKDADSIIIFVQYKEAQRQLADWFTENGYSNRTLNGDTSNVDRKTTISGFKNGEFRVLLTNVQKGLNFGNCNYCIFYSFESNPASMVQFEGRITRDFDIVDKNIYILCSMGEEYKSLMTTVRERAKASTQFTNTDLSVVLDILLGSKEA